MKVLVVGHGGREHAIVMALLRSPSVVEVHCAPGSDGIRRNALCHDIKWQNSEAIVQLCLRAEIDVVMVGPEDPLVGGLSDALRERGILVVGPSSQAAKLEGSKIHAKEFMAAAGIPTARYARVDSLESTLKHVSEFTAPYVLKADGLAAGKGVFICKTIADLTSAAQQLFEKNILGAAGATAILEQFTPGWELSFLILTNGQEWQALPIAQDHKRLSENDEGPNTGGMGTVAPLSIPAKLREQIDELIVAPTLKELQKRGDLYRGVIFFGLMITPQGPSLLEYNVRFGDPETQVILPLIENDFGQVLLDLAKGKVQPLRQKNTAAACVVMAAPGYPDSPKKGVHIDGDVFYASPSSYFVHAGTAFESSTGKWVTNGGRVLGAIGLGSNLKEAIQNAYTQRKQLKWDGILVRSDIGRKITSSI